MTKSECLLSKTRSLIDSRGFLERSRKHQQDFTRQRKLPFCSLIYFFLNLIKQTVQKELTCFIQGFGEHKNISKSAFCQSRMKLRPEAFIELNDELVRSFYSDDEIKTWNKFRLICIDGSTLELPNSPEIINDFGVNSVENNTPIGKTSVCFDLLNEIILDSVIAPNKSSEYYLAVMHFGKLRPKDLVILDRGYGARWLFLMLLQSKTDFVIRIQRGFGSDADEFWNSKEESTVIQITHLPKKSAHRLSFFGKVFRQFACRLVKVELKTGEIEVLATSLIDKKTYPNDIFKDLYNLRWGVESNYHHLKNHIEIGNFTGYSSQSIQQDYNASIFIANVQSLIILDAQQKISSTQNTRKYRYKVNRNLSLGYLKDRIVNILTSNDPNYYKEIVELFQIEPVPIRQGRTFPRHSKRYKRKWYMNQRRAL